MKKIVKIIIGIALLYALFCAMVFFKPQWFFYNPTNQPSRIENALANGYKAQVVHYKSSDGTDLTAWYTKPAPKKKIIVFMHGNSYNVEKFYTKILPLAEAGYGTMMPEYRGFGGIKGIINENNLANDAIAAINYLHSRGYKNSNIIVYGMSLGSYMAINSVYTLQKEGKFAALILEVPFDSLLNVLKKVIPVPMPLDYLVRDKYNNAAMIAEIKSPILIMGGSEDPTVPVELAKNLFAEAKNPKKLIIYQGAGHNDLYYFRNYRDILNWLKAQK